MLPYFAEEKIINFLVNTLLPKNHSKGFLQVPSNNNLAPFCPP